MEFETSTTDASPEVSDAQRLAATGRRKTLAPLHDITQDDEQIIISPREDVPATVQVSEPNVYIPSESEDTSTIRTSDEIVTDIGGLPIHPIRRTAVVIAIGLFATVTAGIIFLMVAR